MPNEKRTLRAGFGVLCVLSFYTAGLYASSSDPIGANLLSQVTTNLNGAGVQVAQAEAGVFTSVIAVYKSLGGVPAR